MDRRERGKSWLIGGLELCGDADEYQVEESVFEVIPGNEEMVALSRNAKAAPTHGGKMQIRATDDNHTYEFTLRERKSDPQTGSQKLVEHRFQVMDGKGEWLFNQTTPEQHERMRESDGYRAFVEFGRRTDAGDPLC